ncbi:hypothetical protein [Bizionia myxarmorum]|uniref:Uncharacterized protein n=1 Tax=Bizionia myxarmorum TaxID=291186 RepID=A0A5D0RE04_9FLAO|nr:hypothetical protein [Bizionia myxarmorum]TYB79181.1 hypothetical protein ES674_05240 [Bizionia myxarmorum]
MSRIEIKCRTASKVEEGVVIKPSQLLTESIIHLEPDKMPTAETIELIRQQFSHIAVLYSLPDGEACTCEIRLID